MKITPLEKLVRSHCDVLLLLLEGKFNICLVAFLQFHTDHNVPDNK